MADVRVEAHVPAPGAGVRRRRGGGPGNGRRVRFRRGQNQPRAPATRRPRRPRARRGRGRRAANIAPVVPGVPAGAAVIAGVNPAGVNAIGPVVAGAPKLVAEAAATLGLTFGGDVDPRLAAGGEVNTTLAVEEGDVELAPSGSASNPRLLAAYDFGNGIKINAGADSGGDAGTMCILVGTDANQFNTDPIRGLIIRGGLVTPLAIATALGRVKLTNRRRARTGELHGSLVVRSEVVTGVSGGGIIANLPATTSLADGTIGPFYGFDMSSDDDALWAADPQAGGATVDTGTVGETQILALAPLQKAWLGETMPGSPNRLLNKRVHFTPSMASLTNQGQVFVIPIAANTVAEAINAVANKSPAELKRTIRNSYKLDAKQPFSVMFKPSSKVSLTDFAPSSDDITDVSSCQWTGFWFVAYVGVDTTATFTMSNEASFEHAPPARDPDTSNPPVGSGSPYQVASASATPARPANGTVENIMNLYNAMPPIVLGTQTDANTHWYNRVVNWFKENKGSIMAVGKQLAGLLL